MSKVLVFFAEGFEEIEALTVVDLLRRSKVETCMVSVTGGKTVKSSHGVEVVMDEVITEVDFDSAEVIVLPGGMPGTLNLEANELLMSKVDEFYNNGKKIAAICAAPSIFGHKGILKGRSACSYPSFESHLEGANVSKNTVEVSDNVITSRGMGTAIDFGLKLVEVLCGVDKAEELAKSIVYR